MPTSEESAYGSPSFFRNKLHQSIQFAVSPVGILTEPIQNRGGALADRPGAVREDLAGGIAQRGLAQPLNGVPDQRVFVRGGHPEHPSLCALQIIAKVQRRPQSSPVRLQGLDVAAERLGGGKARQDA